MLKRATYSLVILPLLAYALFGLIKPSLVKADVASCQASLVAHAVTPNSQNSFNMHITNTGINAINGVRISRPSANFTILGNSAPGWTDTTSPEFADESNGNLASGDSMDVSITVQSANVQAGTANWIVSASDTNFNNFSCAGNLGMSITGDLSDLTPPSIYNIAVSDITTSGATITWSTDEASDSTVNYGQTDSYGNSTDVNSDMVTNHSVNLRGLSPNTGYHYQVVSADAAGNSSGSSDNTFLSASLALLLETSSRNASSPLATTIPIKAVATEHILPTIQISLPPGKTFPTAPTITGSAQDNEAVASIEYSTDNGKNWLPANETSPLGGKNATFSFTPLNLAEGSYKLLARAIDTSGNIGQTPASQLVIDRLPPLVGGIVLSLGPEVLQSELGGEISVLAGVDEKVTLSAVGGATSISLNATGSQIKNSDKSFSLTQSQESGLWSGIISFGKAGTYQLASKAVDGGGNRTSKILNTVRVAEPAKIISQSGQPISATITAYYLEPQTNSWVIWDAAAYDQANPQQTNKDGTFNLYLPAGKYYLSAKARGYTTITTSIFKLAAPSPVITTLHALKTAKFLGSGGLNFSTQAISISARPLNQPLNPKASLVGKQLPDFKLLSTSGQSYNSTDLLGKPTVLSFMSTWAPGTSDQLPALNALAANRDINVEPVALQQSVAQIGAYQSLSGNELDWLTDPDGTTTGSFDITGLPTHYFIDRNGIVKKVLTGVLSKQELLSNLSVL